jgi:hypothetical protein
MDLERRISLAVAAVFVFLYAILREPTRSLGQAVFAGVSYCIVCLAFIWYSDELGAYVCRRLDRPTPGIMIKIAGWFFLVLLVPLVIGISKLR